MTLARRPHLRRARLAAAPALALAVALAAAGCGGGSASSSSASGSSSSSAPSGSSSSASQSMSSMSSGGGSVAAPAGADAVSIDNFAYGPKTITVKAGTKVTWTNHDSANHTVTADDGSFDLGNLNQGQAKSRTFTKPGRYAYHCSYHPFMHGMVVVR